jgi:putative transposase
MNRGNAKATVFHKDEDYKSFVTLLADAQKRLPMRLLAYCLMPNHFHLVVWPRKPGELSRWMQWLLTSHVRRYHRHYQTSGHVWQGRFKAFPIQADDHLLAVWRYVEQNPLRANLVDRVEHWPWSSLSPLPENGPELTPSPIDRPQPWLRWVGKLPPELELAPLRSSVLRGAPFGDATWTQRTAKKLGLESSLRPRGRPSRSKK